MFSRSLALLRSKSVRFGGVLAAVAALAGCGGTVVDEFEPARIVSLGDEYSHIDSSGRKYTVNGATCSDNPIWNQRLVESYGFSFKECNPNNRDESKALLYAREGARILTGAGSIVAQLAEHEASPGGGFRSGDLVLVMAGAHDMHDIAAGAGSDADKIQAARDLGRALAQRLNALLDKDVRLVVLSVPDQGTTPEVAAQAEAQRALLSRLTTRFNEELDLSLANDGRRVGWVSAQGEINRIQFPGDEGSWYGVTERNAPACPAASAPADCSTTTANAAYATHLYAFGRHLSTIAHERLFALAESRARDNPF